MWILGKVGAAVLLHQHRPAAVTAAADKEQQQQQQQQSSPCLKNIFVWKSNLIATCSFAILNHPQPVLLLLATSNQTRDSIEIKSNSNWNQAKLMLCSPIVIAQCAPKPATAAVLHLHYSQTYMLLSVFWMQVLCEWKWSINIWAHQQNWSMYKFLPLTEFLCQPEGFLRCSAKIGSTIIFSRLVDFRGNQHILGTLYAYCEILTPGLLVILTWEGGGDLTV